MNIIDVIGPIMIGPSSSHTAGAVRLGLLAASILGSKPVEAVIALHGSFAHTYRGHGTDRALLAGLMGWHPDDARIPQALEFALHGGMDYKFTTIDLGELTHPNTAYFTLKAANGRECEVIGSSVGGGQVIVTSVDGFLVELTGKLPVILTKHQDKPGVIAMVTGILAKENVNVASMRVFRANKGGIASMVLECDHGVSAGIVDLLKELDVLETVHFIDKVL